MVFGEGRLWGLAAGGFGVVAEGFEVGDGLVFVVALDDDFVVGEAAAGAEVLFELFGEGLEFGLGEVEFGDDGGPFAAAFFAADSWVLGGWGGWIALGVFGAGAVVGGVCAVFAGDGAFEWCAVEEAGHG